jgi:hypothetical protein
MTTPQGSVNPLSGAGIFVLCLAILLMLGGAGAGWLALEEFSRWSRLSTAGNPFADVAANSGVYLAGISATALLSGGGLLVVGILLMSGKIAARAR